MRQLPVIESRSAVYEAIEPRPARFGEGGIPQLQDEQGRRYDYLRLSVTDRCDMACTYCMPPSGEEEHARRKELLSFEEASRIVSVFAAAGIRRVRFTGGEPLVRKDFVELVDLVQRTTPIEKLVMTTNASRLAEQAVALREAGLSGVNVSLDSLDPERFATVTRGGDLKSVLAGIRAAVDVGFEVKLNTVALRGITDDEAARIVDFAWEIGATPRFIELMPLGEGAKLPPELRIPASEIMERLGDRLGDSNAGPVEGQGPANYREAADGSGRRVGFITPLSDEFCGTCNRVRVTAQGDVRACLASRRAISLRDTIRAGGSDLDLAWAMHWSLSSKAQGHFFTDGLIDEHENVGMSLIGG